MSSIFTKYISIFGIAIVASEDTPDNKVIHAASVLVDYLDNDENGIPDNTLVINSMIEKNALLLILTENDHDNWESEINQDNFQQFIMNYNLQDLYANEIHPEGSSSITGFDATLEEVLHLITTAGYRHAYPSIFGLNPGSTIANYMDQARGGYFPEVPTAYPDTAWFTYNDTTCSYGCMITEYFYWALTSILGAQEYPGRLNEIQDEWTLNTPELVQSEDPNVYNLLTNPEYQLPH